MAFLIIAAMHPESVRSFWSIVTVVAVGLMALAPFSRRIGGPGGGAEKAIVGVIWVVSAIALGFFMFHGA
ncbi:hypothetical protein GCM10009559_02890 [Pseudonocardia zijingensis]|uniref:Uncharacterized protein n=1 Tax=Pseudonocardia zijingensis TaxID=153376 RepID=A0ABN1P071_9PSEU